MMYSLIKAVNQDKNEFAHLMANVSTIHVSKW